MKDITSPGWIKFKEILFLIVGLSAAVLLLAEHPCIGKFLAGCQKDCREPELLVKYHDRLRDLGELPTPQQRQ